MSEHIVHDSTGSWCQCPNCKGTGVVDYYPTIGSKPVKVKCSIRCKNGRRYVKSHSGDCICRTCGTVNKFRSDFTYDIGGFMANHWCAHCERFGDQYVTRLDHVTEVSSEH